MTSSTVNVHRTLQSFIVNTKCKGRPFKTHDVKGGDEEHSQVFAICCVHGHTRTRMVPNSVTRNKSMQKVSCGRTKLLNLEFRRSIADGHKHSHH